MITIIVNVMMAIPISLAMTATRMTIIIAMMMEPLSGCGYLCGC